MRLVGGETAEHPGVMPDEDYDVAGFSVGVVDEEKIIDGKSLALGDVLLGLGSTGVHSNGFSLVRKVFDVEHADLNAPVAELGGKSLGETLLTPTRNLRQGHQGSPQGGREHPRRQPHHRRRIL